MSFARKPLLLRSQTIASVILLAASLTGCGADKLPETAPGATGTTASAPGNGTTSGAGANSTTTSATSDGTTTGAAGPGTTGVAAKTGLPVIVPQSPGPYTTLMIGDLEMKQGRFPAGVNGGSLVRSMVGTDPKTFNYWAATDTGSGEMAGLMFSAPITIDPYTGEMIPDLAESFKVEADGVTYTTKLRKGLKWSDGQPLTAQDVAFTWNTIIAGGYGNSSIKDTVTVEGKMPVVTVVDTLTNKYVTAKPFAPFKRALAVAVAPKHVIEPIIKTKDGQTAFQNLWSATLDPSTLVVSGPYKLSRFVPAQRCEFVPNKNYAMVNKDKKPLPYLKRVIYQTVPDANTNLLKFRAREIDITPMRAKDLADIIPAQQAENFKLYNLGPSNSTTFLMFNMNRRNNKAGKPYVDPIKSVWFNDTNFRQAINHTIKRQDIIQNYFKGVGSQLFGSISESSPWFDKSLKPFPPDTTYALELLKKSGFVKKPDGFLYDGKGNKVEFTLNSMSGSTFLEASANIIVENLKTIGITANLQELAFNVLADKTSNSLDWETCLMGLSAGDALEPNGGANVWRSDGRMHMFDQRLAGDSGKTTVTDARPWEKRLDDLFTSGAETMDEAKRHKIYDETQQIIYDQAPFVYLVTPMSLMAARNTIQNYSPTPLALAADSVGLHNVDEVWKKQP